MNVQTILYPTDLSEHSLHPLERDPSLFEGKKVTLLAVVLDVPMYAPASPFAPPVDSPQLAPRVAAAEEGLKAMLEHFPVEADVDTRVIVDVKDGRAIANHAAEHGYDLIVLSTHGRTGFRRWTLGSVAEAVLRHAKTPVLTFPMKEAEQG